MQSTPKILKAHGYATACVGKKHVEPPSVYPFDYEPQVDPRSPADIAAKVAAFLAEHRDDPFYLHVGSAHPHRASVGFGNHLQPAGIEPVPYDPEEVIVPNFLPDVPRVREDLAEYYQSISRFDQVVGAVLRELDASGRADETLLFVTTDHAMPFPGAKASSFDSGHRCPLIVVNPVQRTRGIRSQAVMSWVDFCPTILEWCGVEHPEGEDALPGRSLLPILEDGGPQPGGGEWEETYFSHCFHEITNYYPYRVLRARRYKYVLNLAHQLETPLPSDLFRSLTWTAVRDDNLDLLGERSRARFLQQDREALFDMEPTPASPGTSSTTPPWPAWPPRCAPRSWPSAKTRDPWLELYQRGEAPSPAG